MITNAVIVKMIKRDKAKYLDLSGKLHYIIFLIIPYNHFEKLVTENVKNLSKITSQKLDNPI